MSLHVIFSTTHKRGQAGDGRGSQALTRRGDSTFGSFGTFGRSDRADRSVRSFHRARETSPARRGVVSDPCTPVCTYGAALSMTGHGCRMAPACARPSAPRSRNATAAIPPRVFRPRVSDAAHHRWRFEPCDRCRAESAPRRAGSAAHERRFAFPAAAPAGAVRHPCPVMLGRGMPVRHASKPGRLGPQS